MNRFASKTLSVGLAALERLLAAPAPAGITYEMVTVDNAGNSNDTGGGGIGAVAYEYQIGKYEVTIGQYATFLNAADPEGTNPNAIYNPDMASDLNGAGISCNSEAGSGSKYSVINNGGDSASRPITYVSWFDAARFANWMSNGQGTGSTETGAYTLVAGQTSGTAPSANAGAAFRLPTANEWYKTAYYSQDLNGGTGGYYAYATQSDTAPDNQINGTANQANWYTGNRYSVTQSPFFLSGQNYLNDVGAFTGSESFYGMFDRSGTVYEWNDLNGLQGSNRELRGGDLYYGGYDPAFRERFSIDASYGFRSNVGFRLASPVASDVPEIAPSSFGSALALVLGSLGLLERRRAR